MGGSPSQNFDVKRLHQLLSARAYLRAALYNIRIGRIYLDSRKDFYIMVPGQPEGLLHHGGPSQR